MAVQSQTPRDGWCSQTGYRCAETAVQRRIVELARSASGPSGRSTIEGGPWKTDAADGDGLRMRNAIGKYVDFVRNRPRGVTLEQVKAQMRQALSATYTSQQQSLFVTRIIERTPNYPPNFVGPILPAPATDQQALDYLGVQKQCVEWADTIALQAGGRALRYDAAAVPAASARPGMGLFKVNTHAAIILDIQWKGGVPVAYRLAEANYGSGWSQNPPGQVPWLRTVRTDRMSNGAGHKVVSFDR